MIKATDRYSSLSNHEQRTSTDVWSNIFNRMIVGYAFQIQQLKRFDPCLLAVSRFCGLSSREAMITFVAVQPTSDTA